MASMIIAGEKYQMPVWLKARLLQVQPSEDKANILIVESGSEAGKTYPVEHDGQKSTHCPCKAVIDDCAHRMAADRYLATCKPQVNDEPSGELAAIAEQIVAEERAHKQPPQKTLPRINTGKHAVSTPNYQPHHIICQCGADDWQMHYKREFQAYQQEEARKAAERQAYRDMFPDDFYYFAA